MKMFSFSRSNERPMVFMTCLKSWFWVDISRYDTFNSETIDTTNLKKNCLKLWIKIRVHSSIFYSYCTEIRRKTSSLLATRSCLVIIIFLGSTRVFLSHFSVDFLEIFRKDVFSWKDFACKISNFNSLPVWSYRPFSDFLKVLLVHVSPPLLLKLESWNFYTR